MEVTVKINEDFLKAELKNETRNLVSKTLKKDIETTVKGRKVKIEGLIESCIREEVKNLIKTDESIKNLIKCRINEISKKDILESFNNEFLSEKVDVILKNTLLEIIKNK